MSDTLTGSFAGWLAEVAGDVDPNIAVTFVDSESSSFGVVTEHGHALRVTVEEG